MLLHVCAKALWVFWEFLWVQRNTPPYAILLQDHGSGRYFRPDSNWGSDFPHYVLAEKFKCLPRWLLVGDENTQAWPGYSVRSGARRTSRPAWQSAATLSTLDLKAKVWRPLLPE